MYVWMHGLCTCPAAGCWHCILGCAQKAVKPSAFGRNLALQSRVGSQNCLIILCNKVKIKLVAKTLCCWVQVPDVGFCMIHGGFVIVERLLYWSVWYSFLVNDCTVLDQFNATNVIKYNKEQRISNVDRSWASAVFICSLFVSRTIQPFLSVTDCLPHYPF